MKTPLTDAYLYKRWNGSHESQLVEPEFAQKLERKLIRAVHAERELAEARERLAYLFDGKVRTESLAILQLHKRMLEGESIPVNEVEAAIDIARAAPGGEEGKSG